MNFPDHVSPGAAPMTTSTRSSLVDAVVASEDDKAEVVPACILPAR
jgi:hypothetical protein